MNIDVIKRRVLASTKQVFNPLLDDFPNASAAYSLRLLNSQYTGNCIEVRRSSDNALQNIGFVNGILDTTSLLSFVGAGDGFVRTWYDQSGTNINIAQGTLTTQPQIVHNGVVINDNLIPTLRFDGLNDRLSRIPSIFNSTGYGTIFTVNRQLSQVVNERYIFGDGVESTGSVRAGISYRNPVPGNTGIGVGGRRISSNSFQGVGNQSWSGNQFLVSALFKWAEARLENYINGNSNGVLTPFQTAGITNNSTSIASIGSLASAQSLYFNGNISEVITYNLDQSSNRSAIEQNINAYYNIF